MQTQTVHEEAVVLREDRDGVAILRLNRPKALNALHADLIRELDRQLASLETAADIHGIIITGAGEKAFGAGADIGAMADLPPQEALAWGRRGQALANRIQNHAKPIVSA